MPRPDTVGSWVATASVSRYSPRSGSILVVSERTHLHHRLALARRMTRHDPTVVYPPVEEHRVMRVTFLGTGGAVPTTQRNTSALAVNRDGDRLLFDCGEGTQRQMMRFGTGFTVDHVFVTHCHGDHVLGLPGLLQTLDFNDREDPLAVHAPHGTRATIEELTRLAGTDPSYPVRITQNGPGDTVLARPEYQVRGVETDHQTQSLGYALVEADRKGRFDREKAEEELGIPPGPKYSTLHAGHPVEHDGRTIAPDEVVGPPRPGRRVVYTGDTRPTDTVVAAAEDADLLVHDGTFASDWADRARKTSHATAREAARVARDAGANCLALVHISTRYAGDPSPIEQEAREAFDGGVVVPDDGDRLEVPYPDGDVE
jgi:ribonuclease Z